MAEPWAVKSGGPAPLAVAQRQGPLRLLGGLGFHDLGCPLCLRRFFTRVSGWGPGQLESECAAGVWFTAAASAGLVLDTGLDGAEMWHKVRMPRLLTWAPAVQASASK